MNWRDCYLDAFFASWCIIWGQTSGDGRKNQSNFAAAPGPASGPHIPHLNVAATSSRPRCSPPTRTLAPPTAPWKPPSVWRLYARRSHTSSSSATPSTSLRAPPSARSSPRPCCTSRRPTRSSKTASRTRSSTPHASRSTISRRSASRRAPPRCSRRRGRTRGLSASSRKTPRGRCWRSSTRLCSSSCARRGRCAAMPARPCLRIADAAHTAPELQPHVRVRHPAGLCEAAARPAPGARRVDVRLAHGEERGPCRRHGHGVYHRAHGQHALSPPHPPRGAGGQRRVHILSFPLIPYGFG
ncbi:hypothetical protein FA95DRAFT_135469 [Auriscalpium vulgare]|uniref:Uncharacterized protein n=1 Tax=Auriscalpium vulgare TaxID=40419 RepID=A0ACB8R173_9AGAM|nr:hypothetical protein FA95DRAFT_135469 [Auriscalpium vulgare]